MMIFLHLNDLLNANSGKPPSGYCSGLTALINHFYVMDFHFVMPPLMQFRSTSSACETSLNVNSSRTLSGISSISRSLSFGKIIVVKPARCALNVFSFNPPIGNTRPRKCYFSCHPNFTSNRSLRQCRYKCSGNRNTCRWTIFRNSTFWNVNMNIILFMEYLDQFQILLFLNEHTIMPFEQILSSHRQVYQLECSFPLPGDNETSICNVSPPTVV